MSLPVSTCLTVIMFGGGKHVVWRMWLPDRLKGGGGINCGQMCNESGVAVEGGLKTPNIPNRMGIIMFLM